MTIKDLQIAIKSGHILQCELEAVARDGNAFNCDLANRCGLSFEEWLRWGQLPNADASARRWAASTLAKLSAIGALERCGL